MAGKTNTEKIQELSDKLTAHIPATQVTLEVLQRKYEALASKCDDTSAALESANQAIAVFQQRIAHLEQRTQESPSSRVAVIEQRCTQLEKQSDRRWQVWLAILGSFLALLVAVLRK